MRSQVLRLITFDATGTILVLQPPVAQKYVDCGEKFGVNTNTTDVMKNFKLQYKAFSNEHPNFGQKTGLGWNEWWTGVVINTFKAASPKADATVLRQIAQHLVEEYKTERSWALASGSLDLLSMLKKRNIPIGVISNYDERLPSVLRALKVDSFFDFVVTSYSAGVMKPDKRIFDVALHLANLDPQSSHNCMHVGNSVEFDYEGATKAGWRAAYVGEITDEVDKNVDQTQIFKNLEELRKYLAEVSISTS